MTLNERTATVEKVKELIKNEVTGFDNDDIVIMDNNDLEIKQSKNTRGIQFWKGTRKIKIAKKSEFDRFNQAQQEEEEGISTFALYIYIKNHNFNNNNKKELDTRYARATPSAQIKRSRTVSDYDEDISYFPVEQTQYEQSQYDNQENIELKNVEKKIEDIIFEHE